MKEKVLTIKKTVLRFLLVLAVSILAGGAPGAALISYAETEAAAAETEAMAAENAGDDQMVFMLAFFGGIILLILFVVAVTVAVATSTAGVVGAEEDD